MEDSLLGFMGPSTNDVCTWEGRYRIVLLCSRSLTMKVGASNMFADIIYGWSLTYLN